MKRLPIWFERAENLAIGAAAVAAFVHLHFSWWWLLVFFPAFDASMTGYLIGNRTGAVCYNLAHAYVVPAVLLLSYALTATRWCAFAGLLWAFHIAGDRVLGYGLKFVTSFQDTHLGRIGKQRMPASRTRGLPGLQWPVIHRSARHPDTRERMRRRRCERVRPVVTSDGRLLGPDCQLDQHALTSKR